MLRLCSHCPEILRAWRQWKKDLGAVGIAKFNFFLRTSFARLFYRIMFKSAMSNTDKVCHRSHFAHSNDF